MPEIGDRVGLGEAKIEQRAQRLRARAGPRARGNELQRLRPALRPGVGKGRGLHRDLLLAAWRAANTREGLAGRSNTSAPRRASASLIAFTIAAGGPIAPLSPIPFWPKVVQGLSISMCSSRTSGTSVVPGSR